MLICIRCSILLMLVTCTFEVTCQPPDYIYEGGIGGGYTSVVFSDGNYYFYEGANGGGFASSLINGTNVYLYRGGNNDGFTSTQMNAVNVYLFRGGNSDGFISELYASENLYLYHGGENDGYTTNADSYEGVNFYEGDVGQGYVMTIKCADFIWTGTVGTGWGVEENWNYNLVPDINRPVIIPSGAPNYPNVNEGILSIGKNPNSGEFVCKSIWVQSGGELFTRINNFVENYGEILIDGNMRVRNSAPNAIQNIDGGKITIGNGGALVIKP
ncbi:MAG: hypothetical protein AAGA77_11050 [Bacteroidota bacterium]